MHSSFCIGAIAIAAIAGLGVSTANADLINIVSNNAASSENLGSYTGTLSYTALTANTASIVLTLTNTTSAGVGGYITAVALMHSSNYAGATLTLTSSTDADFGNLAPPVSSSPFGSFQGGASTSSSWLGGGAPSAGVSVGQSITLTFSLTGTNMGLLSAADLVGLHSGSYDMAVRFRGMTAGGSDKVPGLIVTPTPGAAAALGLGGLAACRRRRR